MQKAVMKRCSLEKKSLKKNQQIFKNLQKAKKKTIVVGLIKRKEINFLTT